MTERVTTWAERLARSRMSAYSWRLRQDFHSSSRGMCSWLMGLEVLVGLEV